MGRVHFSDSTVQSVSLVWTEIYTFFVYNERLNDIMYSQISWLLMFSVLCKKVQSEELLKFESAISETV